MPVARIALYLGIPQRDWCDRCRTSAVLFCNLYTFTEDGPLLVGSYRSCQRCEEDDDAPR